MPQTTIDTPASVVQVLNDDGAVLPPRTTCDVFSKPDAKVRCLVCSAPAMKRGDPQVVVALMGASRHEQREAATVLQRLIGDDADSPVGLRVLQTGGVTLMLAPWSARELVRGIAESVSASWHPERVTIDGDRLEGHGVVVVPGPGSHGDLAVEIRHVLDGFVVDSGSLWESARRLFNGGRSEPKRWTLPLGCTLVEYQDGRRTWWDIGFEDVNKLDDAAELVESRLARGKDRLLQRWTTAQEDHIETRLPSIMLTAPTPSREARAQLARLLQNVLLVIGQPGFLGSRPGELRNAAGQLL